MTTQFHHLTGQLSAFEELALKVDDPRPHPEEAALDQLGGVLVNELLDAFADTALEDFQATIVEGVIGGLHSAIERIRRDADRARDDVRRLLRDMDGSEVADSELQEATRRFTAADVAVMALEIARDAASANYTVQTGEVWTPWRGSVRRSGLTAGMIDARDALRSRKQRRQQDLDPGQIVVAFRGSPNADTQIDVTRLYDALNWAKQAYPGMALATCGARGAEKHAIRWAGRNGVTVVLATPEFERLKKAAPFKANDDLLEFEPVLVLTLANTLDPRRESTPAGYALNLGQKAEAAGIRHLAIREATLRARA